jgi:hypothetical protein
MALTEQEIAEIQRLLQESPEELTEEQIVNILNEGEDVANQFIRQGSTETIDSVDAVFTRFERNDIVRNRRQFVTQGAWANGQGRLEDFALDNVQAASESGRYFYEVYDSQPPIINSDEASQVQFYLAYGHVDGATAPAITTDTPGSTEPPEAVYAQYRNILLPEDQERFTFADGTTSDDIFVINVARSSYKQRFDPGNWQLTLRFEDPNDSNVNYSEVKLVDEAASTDFLNEQLKRRSLGRVYNVVSGSLNPTGGSGSTQQFPVIVPEAENAVDELYGKFYPEYGIIILNPNALVEHAARVYREGPEFDDETLTYDEDFIDHATSNGDTELDKEARVAQILPDTRDFEVIRDSAGPREVIYNGSGVNYDYDEFEWVGGFDGDDNAIANVFDDFPYLKTHEKLYNAIVEGGPVPDGGFRARSVEEIVSSHFFIRVRNQDYNYSNNPTFSQESGEFTNPDFIDDPKVFITTVGLYDDDNNLVSVAKLSKPVQKDFSNEALIKVKLDFVWAFMAVSYFLHAAVGLL